LTCFRIPTGILGGTFNPIHIGHLRSAEEIREAEGLSEIWFLPSAIPPHKDNIGVSFYHRLNMVRLSVEQCPFFSVLDIEGARRGPSFSIDTLKHLVAEFGDRRDFYFILGSDAFWGFKTWKDYVLFPEYAKLVIMLRDESGMSDLMGFAQSIWTDYRPSAQYPFRLVSRHFNEIIFHKVTNLAISSTKIRALCSNKRSIRFLVTDRVDEYISSNRLYSD